MSFLRLKKMAKFAHGRILDIGFAQLPNPYLKGTVIGFDRSNAVKKTNYRSLVVGNAENFCFASKVFDTIIAGEFIEHLENPIQFLRDCYNILKPDGSLILSTPNPYYPPYIILNWLLIRKYFYAEEHLFAFTPRLMMRLCERAGFKVEHLLSGGMILPFGQRQITIPVPRAICYHIIYICKK
ncbi:Methyltransferase type 11 domain-containing protein [Candidatus Magnetomoraceae bacterium gMMP-15]